DVLITCMRQNPKWILLSEVRSAEAVTAVRNSISSGHNILSTIHSDKAESIPHRMYSLLETNIDVDQFLKTIYRYIQLGVHIRAHQDSETKRMHREVCEVIEFYVTQEGLPQHRILYKKAVDGRVIRNNPSEYLNDYLISQGITLTPNNNEVKDTMGTKKNNNLENFSEVEVLEIN
ncbi:MAG: ATPase, T2SS/T4P/T4SS family, partial [Bacilli bacterium]